jgi:hypothetical protein
MLLPSLAEFHNSRPCKANTTDLSFRLAFYDCKPDTEPESNNAGAQRWVQMDNKAPS